MNTNKKHTLTKRVLAVALAVVTVLTAVPNTPFIGYAKKATNEAWDGTFENGVIGKTPEGWTLVSSDIRGNYEKTGNFAENYKLTTSSESKSGSKALEISPKNLGTQGYAYAESDLLDVEADTAYSFNYAIKIQGVESSDLFFGGKVYISQYDKKGNELKRTQVGSAIQEDTDWETFTMYVQTEEDTEKVKFSYWIGGKWQKNEKLKIFIDDVEMEKISDEKLLNGNFESGSGKNDIYSWHMSSKNIFNEVVEDNYVSNYTMVRETNGYHGDAVAVTRNSWGYVTLDSNKIKIGSGSTYIIDLALRIQNADEDFEAVHIYVAEYDKSGKRLKPISLIPRFEENIDWTEVTGSYTPSKEAVYFQLEFWCGGFRESHFTANFDDVRITTIRRNTSTDGVNNGNFEEVYDGAVFDWTLVDREDTKLSSTFDGYNGTKGIYCIKTSKEKHGYACMQSNLFDVVPGQDYKMTYMSRLANQVGNVYIVVNACFYDAEGNRLETLRDQEHDQRTKSDEWQCQVGYYTAPERAATCKLEFLICGTSYECWIDDVTWNTRDDEANVYGFDAVDNKGNLVGWTVTQPAAAKVDTKTYRQGTSSLFISQTTKYTTTRIMADGLIPISKGTRYKFSAYVKSYDCDVDSEGIRMWAIGYDQTGKKVATIEGIVRTLNKSSEESNWTQMIFGVNNLSGYIAYIRPYIDIAPGKMNVWIDDFSWEIYDTTNEFYEDFDSIRDDGAPDGWDATAISGKPSFVTSDSVVSIKAGSADDKGMIVSRWNTMQEYITCIFNTTYSTTPGTKAKVSIKFYDYKNQEITNSRQEQLLESTGGQYAEYSFKFIMPSVKYATIELSNEGQGTVSFEGLSIVQTEEDNDTGVTDWRGAWIWHDEDYHDSENSTPRYFRYKFTIPDNPAEGTLQITADDRMRLWINGVEVVDQAMSEDRANVSLIDGIEQYMTAGENVIAVSAWNFTSYAGVLFDGYVETESGEWVDFYSTEATVSSLTEVDGWNEKGFDDSSWTNCQIVEKVGGPQWGTIVVFDSSALVKNIFEVEKYTITEDVAAGDAAMLTMTVIPEKDITANIDLTGRLWIRNTEQQVLEMDLNQIDGPAINTWKAGKKITVTYTFEIPDYIGSGKYSLQLNTNQVRISNMEIINNKFTKAIKFTNDTSETGTKTEIVEENGTFVFRINGKTEPISFYTTPHSGKYTEYKVADYMHDSGICITRLWMQVGGNVNIWTGENEYNFDALDDLIYGALSDHKDSYLMLTLGMQDAPDWWKKENPDECIVTSTGPMSNVSTASEKFVEEATQATLATIAHMKEQPYYNRIIGSVLSGYNTHEWIWYGGGTQSIDHSVAGQNTWRAWLTEKYGTDEALQKAWGVSNVSLATVTVPTLEERTGDTYTAFLDPTTQQDALDHAQYMNELMAKRLIDLAATITEAVDDKWVLGPYYGYMNCHYTYASFVALHTAVEKVLEDENIDFLAAPVNYDERYDGEAGGYMQMIDGVMASGKAVLAEDDLRLCPWTTNTTEFFTRDTVGPTFHVSDSVSQLERNFASQIVQGVGNWYFDMHKQFFDREQFSDVIEITQNERVLDIAREKDSSNDVCYIIDEDLYENMAYELDPSYDILYYLLHEQRFEFSRLGVNVDSYHMSDLVKGRVPDHKIYIMLSPVEIDEAEQAAIEKYLKKDDKVVVWHYLCGASDGKTFSAKNMSNVIGMNVTLDDNKRNLCAVISNNKHWLTEGQNGLAFGTTNARATVTPTAIVSDSNARILAYMSDNSKDAALAIKDLGDWTSIYSSVPCIPAEVIRNLLGKYDVHMYSENLNDVIFANTNYVGINCAYGGDKEIKLDGTYAVYDVFNQTTYSLSTDKITFDMEDNSTRLFRLTPADKHVVYVDLETGGKSKQAGYQEITPGKDYTCRIQAEDGYVISGIIVDGELTEVLEKSYKVTFEDLNNSHFVRAQFKKVSEEIEEVVEEPVEWTTIAWIGVASFVVIVAIIVILFILKNKKQIILIDNKSEERK